MQGGESIITIGAVALLTFTAININNSFTEDDQLPWPVPLLRRPPSYLLMNKAGIQQKLKKSQPTSPSRIVWDLILERPISQLLMISTILMVLPVQKPHCKTFIMFPVMWLMSILPTRT
jgi:hypothetical protein